jgi:hypothetical protein
MIIFREIVYKEDGKTEEHSKEFSSKKALIKAMRKSPFPSKAIYDLTKYNEAYCTFAELKRKIWIDECPSDSNQALPETSVPNS